MVDITVFNIHQHWMWTELSNVFVLTLYLQDVFLSLDSAIKNIENGNWKMENS